MSIPRPLLLTLMAAVAWSLVACGGGGGGGGTATSNDPLGWGANTHVEAVFQASCPECHSTAWDSCWSVHGSAVAIGDAISSGAMPASGPLSQGDKSTVLSWIGAGAPCTGKDPNEGTGVGRGGGETPTPIVASR